MSALVARRPVLVTGASSGIGAAIARRLVDAGFPVWAGVRDLATAPPGTRPLALDVTEAAQIAAAARTIAEDGDLYGVVNNAGIAVAAPLEGVPLDAVREQFEVNVLGPLAVTQAMLPLLRRSLGRVVMISSVGGRNAAPYVGPYTASKYALEALSDALRGELADSGIEISLVEPGAVRTPIWDRSRATATALFDRMPETVRARYAETFATMTKAAVRMGAHGVAPDRVAAAVEHALIARRPRTRYLVGTEAKVQVALRRFVPDRARDRMILAALRRAAR